MELGTIVHDLLNKIHIKATNEGEVDDEFIDEIFDNVYENNPFIIEKGYDNIIESIREYWEDYGQDWEIIASELPFTIKGEKYDFAGVIDLIVKEDPDVVAYIGEGHDSHIDGNILKHAEKTCHIIEATSLSTHRGSIFIIVGYLSGKTCVDNHAQ